MPAFTYLGYEGMYLMKWAIENSGIKNTQETLTEDRRKVRDTLANLKDWTNPMGLKLTMGPTGDITRSYVYVIIKDGTFFKFVLPSENRFCEFYLTILIQHHIGNTAHQVFSEADLRIHHSC